MKLNFPAAGGPRLGASSFPPTPSIRKWSLRRVHRSVSPQSGGGFRILSARTEIYDKSVTYVAERAGFEPPIHEAEYSILKWLAEIVGRGAAFFALDLPDDGIADHRLTFRRREPDRADRLPSNRPSRPGQHAGPGDSRYSGRRGSARSPGPDPPSPQFGTTTRFSVEESISSSAGRPRPRRSTRRRTSVFDRATSAALAP
jgi:hypothetical protein